MNHAGRQSAPTFSPTTLTRSDCPGGSSAGPGLNPIPNRSDHHGSAHICQGRASPLLIIRPIMSRCQRPTPAEVRPCAMAYRVERGLVGLPDKPQRVGGGVDTVRHVPMLILLLMEDWTPNQSLLCATPVGRTLVGAKARDASGGPAPFARHGDGTADRVPNPAARPSPGRQDGSEARPMLTPRPRHGRGQNWQALLSLAVCK